VLPLIITVSSITMPMYNTGQMLTFLDAIYTMLVPDPDQEPAIFVVTVYGTMLVFTRLLWSKNGLPPIQYL